MNLCLVPITHAEANRFVGRMHRHSRPTLSAIFCVAVAKRHEIGGAPGAAGYGMHVDAVVGVAIVGRPVARRLQDGFTVEILRVCTDGTRNACSMLYGACRRVARALGYRRIITYTLPAEGGASLRAAGFVCEGDAGGPAARWHNRPGRTVTPVGDDLVGGKWRWAA